MKPLSEPQKRTLLRMRDEPGLSIRTPTVWDEPSAGSVLWALARRGLIRWYDHRCTLTVEGKAEADRLIAEDGKS